MRNFRKAIIGLVLYLTFFFNIERLDIGQENLVNINTYVYVLTILAIFFVISFRKIGQMNPIYGFVFWFSLYFIMQIINADGRSFWQGGIYIYLTITEIALMGVGLAVGHYTANILFDLESTVENITLIGTSSRVKQFDQAGEEIRQEMYRSRRYKAPLSVITMTTANNPASNISINSAVKEMQEEILKHYTVISLAKNFEKLVRRSDMILVELAEDQLVLIAPGTSKEDAYTIINKMQTVSKAKMDTEFPYAVKTFPEDGHTFEELYSQSIEELNQLETNKPNAVLDLDSVKHDDMHNGARSEPTELTAKKE
ncbi:MAG: hypothetical protein P8046_01120 [Anaerolineales bacterium]